MHQPERVGFLARVALLLGLLLLPHQAILHTLMPADLAGKNLWLIVPLGLALLGMGIVVLLEGTPAAGRHLLAAAMLWIGGIWFGLHWPGVSAAEVVINTRPLFLMPLALLAGMAVARDWKYTRWFLFLLIAQGVVQAVIGIVHVHVFPQVVTGTFAHLRGVVFFVTEEWQLFSSREAGLLGNPSAYAEMIGLGAFASCYYLAHQSVHLRNFRGWLLFAGLWLLFILAVIPSLSRVALVFVSAPFLLLGGRFAAGGVLGRRHLLLLAGGVLLVIAAVVVVWYPQLLDRFRLEGMYGRLQKNELLFSVLTSDLVYFFHGVPAELLRSLRTPEGMGFGDNSFLRLAAATGVPVYCAWMAMLAAIWLRIWPNRHADPAPDWLQSGLLLYLLVLLCLGDVLFNDGWILMAAMLLGMRSNRAGVSAEPAGWTPSQRSQDLEKGLQR